MSSPYQPAADLLNQIWERRVSLKSLVFSKDGTLSCSKTTYAQVCQVLRHLSTLRAVKEHCSQLPTPKNEGLMYVLLYELLLGPNKRIKGGGVLKRGLTSHEATLREVLEQVMDETPTSREAGLQAAASFPRYVRINTCRSSMEDVVNQIRGLNVNSNDSEDLDIYIDPHVPDLLVLPPHSTENLLKQLGSGNGVNSVVLQDKSSCFSALCMAHGFHDRATQPKREDYLDACAAPGNKTSHLSALLLLKQKEAKSSIEIKVHAFDRDEERKKLLKRRLNQLIVTSGSGFSVEATLQDFLQVSPEEYPSVKCIMLDPTCSGSGIFTALDERTDQDEKRIRSLSSFQLKMLEHATSFPNVDRIVYSTCSVHVEENEQVVSRLLKTRRDDWEVVSPLCLDSWNRRGLYFGDQEGWTQEEADAMIRASYEDETNGFFVCCLQRKSNQLRANQPTGAFSKYINERAKELGLQVYDGQFSTLSSVSQLHHKKLNHTKGSFKQMPPKKEKQNPPDHDKSNKIGDRLADNQREASKKVVKKLEWKKRQRQEKIARIRKKQQK